MSVNFIRKKIRLILIINLLFLLFPSFLIAQEPGKILIRNVRLINREGKTEDQSVNILIKNKKLNIITSDEIEIVDGTKGFDANNGVLMGTLDIGQPASFVIVDQDPREDINVLYDTKSHLIFSINNGIIETNKLTGIGAQTDEPKEKKKSKWIAYVPPPMALPVAYQDNSKWNRWNTKPISGIFVAAVALDRQRWFMQDDKSEEQVGNLKDYDGGEIRAFRMGVAGTLNFKKPWVYTFIVATHAFDKGYNSGSSDDLTLLDYRLDIPLAKKMALSIGKQKEPVSMERLLLGTQLPMQERPSTVDAMFTFRNVGISMNGTLLKERISWAAGVFNDWFDASQSFNESSNQLIGRITGLAYVNKDERHLLHLGLGLRYNDAIEEINYRSSPEFNQSPIFVETGFFSADFTMTYDFEISWRRGPIWLSSELIRNQVRSSDIENPVFSGYHVSGSYIITQEMHKYNRRNGTFGAVPVSRTVFQGGPGAWEVTARYSGIDLRNGLIDGGKMNILSIGLNWWLAPTFGVNLNYRYIILNQFNEVGRSQGIMARVLLMLE